jgi:hypothetical protein
MQHAIAKGVVGMAILGGIAVGTAGDSISAAKDIIEVAIAIAGMIGVAYVMRADVANLKKWAFGDNGAERRLAATEKNTAVLSTLAEAHDNRIGRIERREDSRT